MRLLRLLLVSCAATVVLQAATVHRLAGPWQVWREDGGLHLALEFGSPLPATELAVISLWHQAEAGAPPILVDVLPEQVKAARSLRRPSWLLSWQLSAEQAQPGIWSVRQGYEWNDGNKEVARLRVRSRPAAGASVAVLVVSPVNYPFAREVDAIEARLGRDLDLVVLLGAGVEDRIGAGGWEYRLPLVVVQPHRAAVANAEWTGSADDWQEGLQVGMLGLPAQEDARIANAVISRDSGAWQVFLDPIGLWDQSLVSESEDLTDLALLLAAGMRRRMPLILGASKGAGHVSEPLGIAVDYDQRFGQLAITQRALTVSDVTVARRHALQEGRPLHEVLLADGRLTQQQVQALSAQLGRILAAEVRASDSTIVLRPGGTRHVAVGAAGGGFRAVPAELALPVHQRGLTVLEVDDDSLSCRIVDAEGRDLVPLLRYDPVRPGIRPTAPAWGYGHADAMSWLQGATVTPEGEAWTSLAWILSARLADVTPTPDALHQLLQRSAQLADGALLLRRLSGLQPVVTGAWLRRNPDTPRVVARDWLLRLLDQPDPDLGGRDVAAVVTGCQDPSLLRSLLAFLDRSGDLQRLQILEHLVQRCRLQLDGSVPHDDDIWIQHGLMSAIFDSPYLSPDALEPLAAAVVVELDGMARRPLVRFLGQRASPEFTEIMAHGVDGSALLEVIAEVLEEHPQSTGSGGLRMGLRRLVTAQAMRTAALLPEPAQQVLMDLVMQDPQWQGERRESVLKALQQRR